MKIDNRLYGQDDHMILILHYNERAVLIQAGGILQTRDEGRSRPASTSASRATSSSRSNNPWTGSARRRSRAGERSR